MVLRGIEPRLHPRQGCVLTTGLQDLVRDQDYSLDINFPLIARNI